jgi:F-type H+-transporting ATPase subunit b
MPLWKDLLYQTINFGALAGILVYFGSKPLKAGLKGRIDTIRKSISDAEKAKADTAGERDKFEASLREIEAESRRKLDEAVAQGRTMQKQIIEEAGKAAEVIDVRAGAQILDAQRMAVAEIRTAVADKVVNISSEVVRRSYDQQKQAKLLKEFINKSGSVEWSSGH